VHNACFLPLYFEHAHHIIPWGLRDRQLVQKAAKSKNAFHINEVLNGIPLPSSNHLTGYSVYNQVLDGKLEYLKSVATTDDAAYNLLEGLISHTNDLIINNPTKNLGEIASFIDF